MNSPVSKSKIFSALPFANIYWWQHFLKAENAVLDIGEHFEKMTFRNRYQIGAANGIMTLSIPLSDGRDQRKPMKEVQISYSENWQKNHWKSLEAAYMRTPFFEFYQDDIKPLFDTEYVLLSDWNIASINVIKKLIKHPAPFTISEVYLPLTQNDFRALKPKDSIHLATDIKYIQPFEHKFGFVPNLSILDLLFCEGPATLIILKSSIIS